jgi:hypothetical protein
MTAAEMGFAARAAALAPAVELSLRTAGLARTKRIIERLAATPVRPKRPAVDVLRGEQLVQLAFRAHPLLDGRCLARSLVQYGLHRRDGVDAQLHIGVRATRAPIDAHAWVEPPEGRPDVQHLPLTRAHMST